MAAPITNPNALKPAGNDEQLIKELKVLEIFYYSFNFEDTKYCNLLIT